MIDLVDAKDRQKGHRIYMPIGRVPN
jgi:hypothetical protein